MVTSVESQTRSRAFSNHRAPREGSKLKAEILRRGFRVFWFCSGCFKFLVVLGFSLVLFWVALGVSGCVVGVFLVFEGVSRV